MHALNITIHWNLDNLEQLSSKILSFKRNSSKKF